MCRATSFEHVFSNRTSRKIAKLASLTIIARAYLQRLSTARTTPALATNTPSLPSSEYPVLKVRHQSSFFNSSSWLTWYLGLLLHIKIFSSGKCTLFSNDLRSEFLESRISINTNIPNGVIRNYLPQPQSDFNSWWWWSQRVAPTNQAHGILRNANGLNCAPTSSNY